MIYSPVSSPQPFTRIPRMHPSATCRVYKSLPAHTHAARHDKQLLSSFITSIYRSNQPPAQKICARIAINSVGNNSLYRAPTSATAGFFVETDPRFANYRNWLSSDYLLNALSIDPATTQRRLGDGFYEQRLIREQVASLTGQRFLADYTSDEQQYTALMTQGATFARVHQLRPGIALTDVQIAQLTSDIVWLVEQTITLPDGRRVQALVPQVYAVAREGDLRADGALIAGRSVDINITGNATNSGNIAGRQVVRINADTINNLGGTIAAKEVGLTAAQDINNTGGSVIAQERMILNAGRDINVTSTTMTGQGSQAIRGGSTQASLTQIDRIAGLTLHRSIRPFLDVVSRQFSALCDLAD